MNSSKPPSSDPPSVNRPPKGPTGRKRGGQPGHKGKARLLFSPEEVDHIVDVKPSCCNNCFQELVGVDLSPIKHQVTEIPPVKPVVTEYRLHTLVCPHCGNKNLSSFPEGVPGSAFGGRLQSMVAMCSGAYRLSKRTVKAVMRDFFGVEMSLGAVCSCENSVSQALEFPVNEACSYMQKQRVKYIDETGWKEGNNNAWLWTVATDEVTVFTINRSRSRETLSNFIGDQHGYISSDRWHAYNIWNVWKRQLCWAHLKRNFIEYSDKRAPASEIAEAILAEIKTMFDWWGRVRDGTLKKSSLRTYMSPLRRRVEDLLRQGTECGVVKTEKAYRKILKLAPALWTFVRTDGIEPTNNLAERAIRPGVIWRNTSFGTDSPRGSRFAERIMTVNATCKQQGKNPFQFIVDSMSARLHNKFPPTLLPLSV